MAIGAKRKRAATNGLFAGERLQRDKLIGEDLYSQWGWVSRISHPSQITPEHRLVACGFEDKIGKPICKNKYAELNKREHKKRKVDEIEESKSRRAVGEDADDVIVISSDDEEQSICSKKGCKRNPQCVNYVGQARFQKDVALQEFLEASHLGPSPLGSAREPGLPIGLRNLGATCYANAFIQEGLEPQSNCTLRTYAPLFAQVWFQDHAFRDGVYRCKPSQEEGKCLEDSPIFQLQVTFAALQESTQNVFNPVKLVESLQLRASEQQDAQEFSKLFMSHLATEFEKQTVPSLKTLLVDQFEGKQTYGTMCRRCHHRSERDSGFLELEINLENHGKLEERIEALLQSEELTEDNKYYCTRCDSLQDATRYTKLRRLPPVLHFSVLRFFFDLATLSRKKSKQAILFPLTLDMTPFVDPEILNSADAVQIPTKRCCKEGDPATDLVYELRGVLLHKGPSAYHGHYEAQVFDVTTRQFYQFNDEIVTPIVSLQGKQRLSKSDKEVEDDSGSAATNKRRRVYSRRKARVDDSDGEAEKRPNASKVDHASDYISSKDAYMLIYARRGVGYDSFPEPPLLARELVAYLNRAHHVACTSYIEREKELTSVFRLMRQKKMTIYSQWEINDLKEESAVVSRGALEDWIMMDIEKPRKRLLPEGDSGRPQPSSRGSSKTPDAVNQDLLDHSEPPADPLDLLAPAPISHRHCLDNSPIVCRHGALDPRRAGDMKRIKKVALTWIRTETGCFFEPELHTQDVCQTCVKELFIDKRYAIDHPGHVAQFDEFSEADTTTQGAWISKVWLRDWRQVRPKMYIPGEGEPAPDGPEYVSHVQCAHGQLSLSSSARRWINDEACTFLQSLFPTWHPMLSPINARTCSACDNELSLSKEAKQEQKQLVDKEKEKLRGISNLLVMNPEIIPGVTQAVVPAEFLRQWRTWIARPQEKSRPGPVDNSWLLCEHGGLIIDPNVPQDLGSSVCLVSLPDWETLLQLYGGGPLITLTGVAQDSQGCESAAVRHDFEVCQKCRTYRLSNFESTNITIRILGDDSNSIPEWQGSKPEDIPPDETKSSGVIHISEKHSNRGRNNGQPLHISSRIRNSKRRAGRRSITIQKVSTVKDIKIEMYNELNIPTICQRLFFKGKELADNLETMASLGIMANDSLDLREEKENDDALDTDAEHDLHWEPWEGQAFGGTVLGAVSTKVNTSGERGRQFSLEAVSPNQCAVCTFLNNGADLSVCAMCGSNINV